MTERDAIDDALALLETPPLPPRFADHVAARARRDLQARTGSATGAGFFLMAGARLVPALLTLAALGQVAATASTAAKIFGKAQVTATQ